MADKIEITVKVNGECVPLSALSDETIAKIRGQEDLGAEKNAPVFSKVSDRLIVRVNAGVLHVMQATIDRIAQNTIKEGCFISFLPSGSAGSFVMGNTWKEAREFYSGDEPQPIFTD